MTSETCSYMMYTSVNQVQMTCCIYHIALCIFLFKYGSFVSILEFQATHATVLTVTVIFDSYDHFSTVTTIASGQLRSYRRCRVCKLRSYCESFTRPYFGNNCTNQQSMAQVWRLMTPPYCALIQEYRFAYKRHNRALSEPTVADVRHLEWS